MNHYRLLRNNKETGPFTEQELIAMGFKPYDLIWTEGKSAGWRYPSELPEFKTHAPIIEEQPFDRFYKKTFHTAALPTEAVIADSPVAIAPGRHIHVTLPAGRNASPVIASRVPEPVVQEKILSPAETATTSFITSSTEPVAKPVEEHHDTVAMHHYPQRSRSSFSFTVFLGLAVGIAALVGLGVMIGLTLNRDKNNTSLNNTLAKQMQERQVQPAPVVATAPVVINPDTTAVKQDQQLAVNTTSGDQNSTPDNSNLAHNTVLKDNATDVTATHKDDKKQPVVNAVVKKGNDATHEDRLAPVEKNIVIPAVNLEKQVNIKTNGYKVGAFGGITDLQCTLTNDSKYALDLVEVELTYIQANDKVFKTETISFKDVAAGTQVTLTAPKSTRGIKVTGKIIKVSSHESGLSKI